jgi:type IV fimbrial biogenesis protein FimT
MTIRRRSKGASKSPIARVDGFTLIEMMMAIVVLAILVGLAVPSFNNASLSSKLTGFANDLVASAQLARSEAVKRNAAVTLCASEDGTTCDDPEGWEAGWIILGPTGVIQRYAPLPAEFRVIQTGGVANIVFPATVAGTTTGIFTVCRAEPTGSQERVVTIGASGGTRVTRTEAATCPD